MAKQQQPFGGAPRLGNGAPGEPADTPSTDSVQSFAGAPVLNTIMHRGEKVVGPNPGADTYPTPYGGGTPLVKMPNQKSASGSGDGTGPGAVSGTQVP